LGLHKAGRKLAASTSPSDPIPSQSHQRLTQSANRNTVERQQQPKPTTAKAKTLLRKKTKAKTP
jgi:hypothetical protein